MEEGKLTDGLPFTLDLKSMIEKSISNLSLDPDQYLKEIIRFALANNPSRIDITDEKYMTEVSFDGPGIASKDELKSLLMSIYNSDETGGINNLGMLGRSVVASLKINPLEVIIKTHDAHSGYIMRIGSKLDQELLTTSEPGARNSFTIVRSKRKHINPLEASIMSYNYAKSTSVSDSLADIYNKSLDWTGCVKSYLQDSSTDLEDILNSMPTRKNNERVNKLKALCWFSETPVYLDKEKINHGFSFPDSIYEHKYEFDGNIRILVSLPKANHIKNKNNKKIIYLRNSAYISHFGVYDSEFNHRYSQLSMQIAVDAPEIKMNMAGDLIQQDDYFYSLKTKIDEARNMFYKDILQNINKIEPHGKYELRHFITTFLHKHLYWQNHDIIKNTKLFSDTDGNDYTLLEVSELSKKQDNKLYITLEELKQNHPLLRDIKEPIFSLESETEEDLMTNLFEYEYQIIRMDNRIKQYKNEKKQRIKESLCKITRNAVKGTAYTTLSSAVLAGSYFGTIFIAPYAIEYWHYGAIATAGSVSICAGVKGVKTASRQISGYPKALEHPWIQKCFESCSRFKDNLKDKLMKIRLNKTETETKADNDIIKELDTSTQEYILTLKKLILSDSENSEFGKYFNNIIDIEVIDKGILSPLFSLKHYDSFQSQDNRTLIINTKRKELSEKSKIYEKSKSAIYYDVLKIGDMLKKKSLDFPSESLEKDVLNAVHLSYLEDIGCSFSEGEDSFKQDFPLLSETEKKGIIKRILGGEITAGNEFDEWIIRNYNSELEYITKESMAGNNLEKITSYIKKRMHSAAEYEYDLLPVREKLDFITRIKKIINSESPTENYPKLDKLMGYIKVKDNIIYTYQQLVYGAKSDDIKPTMKRLSSQFETRKGLESFFEKVNKSRYVNRDIEQYTIYKMVTEPEHERSKLLQTAKKYLHEQKYLQLKSIAELLEKRSENE